MSRVTTFIAVLAFSLLAATPARAQFVPNGSLFVASDGPVNVTLLGLSPEYVSIGTPGYIFSGTELFYVTGPRVYDRAYINCPSGNCSSPTLSAGTLAILASLNTAYGGGAPELFRFTTGGAASNPLFPSGVWAGVFYQPDNTALVGFSPFRSLTSDFSSYWARYSVTNVIGTVPEPSTWMLTLVGLLAAGLMWRRRMR